MSVRSRSGPDDGSGARSPSSMTLGIVTPIWAGSPRRQGRGVARSRAERARCGRAVKEWVGPAAIAVGCVWRDGEEIAGNCPEEWAARQPRPRGSRRSVRLPRRLDCWRCFPSLGRFPAHASSACHAISTSWLPRARCAQTCTTASTSCPFAYRRCASGATTSRCSSNIFSNAIACDTSGKSNASPKPQCASSATFLARQRPAVTKQYRAARRHRRGARDPRR